MKRIVDKSWFFLIEFLCITLAVVLWSKIPRLSWQPLLVAIAPLILRISAGNSPTVRTPFDLSIVIFLLTAGVGVWAAYAPENAWTKFWLILASILFYYLLARQPINNIWIAACILCLMGFGIGIFYFLSNNWETQPQKFQILSQFGIGWMRIRPNLGLEAMPLNDFAGIANLALPFSIALTLDWWRRKSILWSLLFGLMSGLILATILISASRGAWIAVGVTAGLWLLWELTGKLVNRLPVFRKFLFVLSMGLLVCLATGHLWSVMNGRLSQVAIGQGGASDSDQRFHIYWSDIELIKDVPFTGSGLDSFPGLYSSYIMINPNYILGYGHNSFLDATLQQGILGGAILLWIYLGSILCLINRQTTAGHSLLWKAILSCLLIIIFQGFVDDIVYRTIYIPLLFFVPGLTVGLAASGKPVLNGFKWESLQIRRWLVPILIALGIILIGTIALRRPLLSAWYTDLGAVEMAKVELSGFPTSIWDEGQHADLLSPAESLFKRALIYEPTNPGANYRLGLIAMIKRDFSDAVIHLQIAYVGDPYHRGILKTLGLSYIWNGQIEAAIPLLSLIPESDYEVENYTYWWSRLGRPDLAAYAEQYLALVESGQ